MENGRIYKITCSVTKRCYIGKTIQKLNIRFQQHLGKFSCCRLLKEAINEHGKDKFSIETIWEGNFTMLGKMEKKMIEEHNTMTPNGYNLIEGGGRSARYCKESRKLMVKKQREISLRKNGKLGDIKEIKSTIDGRTTSWSVRGCRDGKFCTIGNFNTKEEALKAQDEFTKDPDGYPIPPSIRRVSGDSKGIYYSQKRNNWTVIIGKKNLGRFSIKKQAQYALNRYKAKPDEYENIKRYVKESHPNTRRDNKRNDLGVTYKNSVDKWYASIWKNKKLTSLGCYETKEEAINARNSFIEDPESFVRPNQRKKIKL